MVRMATILVAGAPGSLGRCIVHELKRRGRRVRALTRHPTRLGPVAELCDETIAGMHCVRSRCPTRFEGLRP